MILMVTRSTDNVTSHASLSSGFCAMRALPKSQRRTAGGQVSVMSTLDIFTSLVKVALAKPDNQSINQSIPLSSLLSHLSHFSHLSRMDPMTKIHHRRRSVTCSIQVTLHHYINDNFKAVSWKIIFEGDSDQTGSESLQHRSATMSQATLTHTAELTVTSSMYADESRTCVAGLVHANQAALVRIASSVLVSLLNVKQQKTSQDCPKSFCHLFHCASIQRLTPCS